MHGYRVEFADLLTDRTIYSTWDAADLKYGRKIGDSEAISGTVTVTAANAPMLRQCLKSRTAVWVYWRQDLLAGGVLWDPVPGWSKRAGETWQFNAATFESYPKQVVISEDIGALLQVDQLEIARSLIQHMQADPSADLGIQLDPLMSGVLRDRTQYLGTANKSYGEALSQLGDVQGGFEWTIDVWVDPTTGNRIKYLRFGYPRLGSASAVHVLERDGIEGWTERGTSTGTRYRARGGTPQGNGTEQQQPCISDVYEAAELLAAGWPRIDVVTDYPNVLGDDNLNALAQRDLANGLAAQAIPQVTIDLLEMWITPQAIGETIRLRQRTLLRGLTDEQYRLTGIQVTATERGKPGTAVLTLEAL